MQMCLLRRSQLSDIVQDFNSCGAPADCHCEKHSFRACWLRTAGLLGQVTVLSIVLVLSTLPMPCENPEQVTGRVRQAFEVPARAVRIHSAETDLPIAIDATDLELHTLPVEEE